MKTLYHYRHTAPEKDECGDKYFDWEIALMLLDSKNPDLWWAGRYQVWLKTTATAYVINWNNYTKEEAIREAVRYTNLCLETGTSDTIIREQFTTKS